MKFKNREDAGKQLAEKLRAYSNDPNVIVIALPRGGVVLGRVICDALGAPLDIVVPRKIGAPDNEEYAIGALTEGGEAVWNRMEKERYSESELNSIVEKERSESRRRLSVYRAGLPQRVIKDRVVILVDDGVATGFTIRSAIKTIKAEGPQKIIVALPGGPEDTIGIVKKEVDDVIVIDIPSVFWAVGQLYEDFPQVNDNEVIALLKNED